MPKGKLSIDLKYFLQSDISTISFQNREEDLNDTFQFQIENYFETSKYQPIKSNTWQKFQSTIQGRKIQWHFSFSYKTIVTTHFCTKTTVQFKQLFDKGLKMMGKYIKTFNNPNQWRLNYVKQGGFNNEILFISNKTIEQSWKQGQKTQISRREIGLLSHHTCSSQKMGWISLATLRKCDAYWLSMTDNAMGQGAQLRWVLTQICSWIEWVKLSYYGQ